MKPLGKTVKIAIGTNKPINNAVNDLLISYRSTPHQATGIAPGAMMMRGGYRSHFPITAVKDDEVEKARIKDEESKTRRCDLANTATRRKYIDLQQGDSVLV